MTKLLSFLIITVLASEALCQVPNWGLCPNTTVVQNFNVQRYLGRWFEIKSYFAIFQVGGSCTEANYSLNPNGTVAVLNKSIRLRRPTSILGHAVLVTPGQGKLIVNFPGSPVSDTANYFVLGTDYNNFAVVHSCTPRTRLANTQFAWILSRRRTLSAISAFRVQRILERNNIRVEPFRDTVQENCP